MKLPSANLHFNAMRGHNGDTTRLLFCSLVSSQLSSLIFSNHDKVFGNCVVVLHSSISLSHGNVATYENREQWVVQAGNSE